MSQNQVIENAMKNTGFLGNSGFSQIPVGARQSSQSSQQQALTRNQQGVNTGQLTVNTSQNTVQILSEQGQQAKKDLEILVATGKQLTFNDLDYMFEKDLLKYHRIYQNAIATRVNDTFSTMAVKSYAKLACWLLPIEDENKLYIQ